MEKYQGGMEIEHYIGIDERLWRKTILQNPNGGGTES